MVMFKKKNQAPGSRGRGVPSSSSSSLVDSNGTEIDIQKILKDIEFLGSSNMTWKERKALENRKVVSLGGKDVKKQRIPLSLARVTMKKQKEKEQKMLQEGLVLGRFGGRQGSSGNNRAVEKRKAEDRVLRSSEGYFKNGVLNVKHLLRPTTSSRGNDSHHTHGSGLGGFGGGGKKKQSGGGKKKQSGGGKKKGRKQGNKKRH